MRRVCRRRPALTRGLDLDALVLRAGGDTVVLVLAIDDEIGVSVEVAILNERSRVLAKTRRQQIGDEAGHRCRSQEIVETAQSLPKRFVFTS